MLEALKHLDRELFITLNQRYSDFWNPIMVYASERFFWFPAYFILIVYLIYIFRKQSIPMLLCLGASVALADTISSSFFKPFFGRLRPCHDQSLSEVINLISGCGGKYGFMSSHAANTFALAGFIAFALPPRYRIFKVILLCWAAFISYSRIYLGAHYPGDILAGALLGILLGWVFAMLYHKLVERFRYLRNNDLNAY